MADYLLQWRAAASSTVQGWGVGGWVWCLGTDSKSPQEDAKGGVGTPSALSCPADVWRFTKWCKVSNSFPTVEISVLGRAEILFLKKQTFLFSGPAQAALGNLMEGRLFRNSCAWLMVVLPPTLEDYQHVSQKENKKKLFQAFRYRCMQSLTYVQCFIAVSSPRLGAILM